MSEVPDLQPPVRLPALADYAGDTWPAPPPPRLRLPAGALLVAVLAMVLVPDAGFGANILVVALAVAAAVLLTVRGRAGEKERRPTVWATGLTVLAVLLSGVAVVRASEWLVAGCVLAAVMLGIAVAIGGRSWGVMLALPFLFGEAVLRSMPWAGRTLKRHRPQRLPVESPESLAVGLLFGLVCATVVGMLLAGADATFARLLGGLGSRFTLDVERTDLLVGRMVVLIGTTLFVLGLGFAASTTLRRAPGPAAPAAATTRLCGRHPVLWLPSVVLVALMIAAFLAVDATRLFGGSEAVLGEPSFTHADRAREGFGQLLVVTVLVLLLLGWAGRSARERHRRWLAFGGGTLLVLTLLLAFSALRRLWLYQGEYGWTVTRLNGGAFELWVVLVLIAVGVTWLLRRTDLLPRLSAGSAGLGLLVIALAGPDALVATANVHRYEQTQRIDTEYLSWLSVDAVPALMRLPEPVRSEAMPRSPESTPWYAWNLSRWRAGDLLESVGGTGQYRP